MQMRLHPHAWEWRTPDWQTAAVAGFAASAILMVLELLWTASVGGAGPWATTRMIAAIALGQGVLQGSGFDLGVVTVALLIHYLLGIFSGIVIGIVISGFDWEQSPAAMQAIGAVFGAVIYLVNFHLVTQLFPWVAEMRGWATFVGHLVFGMSATAMYWKLSRRLDPALRL